MSKATPGKLKEAEGTVRDKFLAALMLNGANATKYNELKRSIAENYVTGTSKYPESPELILRILNSYQPPPGWNVNRRKQEAGAGTDKGAAMFAQTGDDSWKADIDCYKCGEKRHLAWECPKKKTKEAEQMHTNIAVEEVQDLDSGENIFVQSGIRGVINRSYVLLDNQSTVDQIAKSQSSVEHQESQESYHGPLQQRIVIHKPRGQSGWYDRVPQPIRHRKCPVAGVNQGQTQGNL
jgi:hypothetical protein